MEETRTNVFKMSTNQSVIDEDQMVTSHESGDVDMIKWDQQLDEGPAHCNGIHDLFGMESKES